MATSQETVVTHGHTLACTRTHESAVEKIEGIVLLSFFFFSLGVSLDVTERKHFL